jgi:uncharacterized membrane protein
MAIVCGYCGASMPDISEFCPSCGRPVREGSFFPPDLEGAEEVPDEGAPPVVLPPVALSDRLVGALAYLTFVPAVLFIFLKQYQQRKFVRFHAFQSVFFWAGVVALVLVGLLVSRLGWLFVWLLVGALVMTALFFVWVVLSVKALQGEWFELPWLGALAEQRAGR